MLIFLAQLEQRRYHPYTKLSGMRLTFSPASFLELQILRRPAPTRALSLAHSVLTFTLRKEKTPPDKGTGDE